MMLPSLYHTRNKASTAEHVTENDAPSNGSWSVGTSTNPASPAINRAVANYFARDLTVETLTRVYGCNDEKNRHAKTAAEHFGEVYCKGFQAKFAVTRTRTHTRHRRCAHTHAHKKLRNANTRVVVRLRTHDGLGSSSLFYSAYSLEHIGP